MEPAKLTRLVRGELDWIVVKALEKDRNRRYETPTAWVMCSATWRTNRSRRAAVGGVPLPQDRPAEQGGLAVVGLVLFFLILVARRRLGAARPRGAREETASRPGSP